MAEQRQLVAEVARAEAVLLGRTLGGERVAPAPAASDGDRDEAVVGAAPEVGVDAPKGDAELIGQGALGQTVARIDEGEQPADGGGVVGWAQGAHRTVTASSPRHCGAGASSVAGLAMSNLVQRMNAPHGHPFIA